MDPFVELIYKNKVLRTQTRQEAGKFPVWNEVSKAIINLRQIFNFEVERVEG